MSKDKKIKKIIIITVILLILVCGVFAGLYFFTDIFKTNKEMFVKTGSQIFSKQNGFIDENIYTYFEKQKNNAFENEGNISFETADNDNSFNISFDGKNNLLESNFEQNVSINYSDSVTFPFEVLKIDNLAGIKLDKVAKQYITINLDKLDNLSENINTEEILEKFNIEFSEEELQQIKDTYLNILVQELQNNQFTKKQENQDTVYSLALNAEEQKNIAIKLLETLENDEIILNKIKDLNKEKIQNLIDNLNDQETLEENNIEILLYSNNKNINKMEFKTPKYVLNIGKTSIDNGIEYNFLVNSEEKEICSLNVSFTNLNELDNVKENWKVKINGISSNSSVSTKTVDEIKILYENTIKFQEDIDMKKFVKNEYIILNELDNEKVQIILNSVLNKLIEVNKEQMNELGIDENSNPIITLFTGASMYQQSNNVLSNAIEEKSADTESEDSNLSNDSTMSDMEKTTFNIKFEAYEGTNQKGSSIKALIRNIETDSTNKIEKIEFDGVEKDANSSNLDNILSNIQTSNTYEVSFEKNSSGYINKVIIK